jgi:hypothetical protein
MVNPETPAILGTQDTGRSHANKPTTRKTKTVRNKDPTKNTRVNSVAHERQSDINYFD